MLLPAICLPAGAADLEELQAHAFFQGVDWEGLRAQEAPQFLPDPADDPCERAPRLGRGMRAASLLMLLSLAAPAAAAYAAHFVSRWSPLPLR